MNHKELIHELAKLCVENGCDETSFSEFSPRVCSLIAQFRSEVVKARSRESMGNRIKRMRIEKNLTQGGLGKLVGVGKAAVHNWENGATKDMKNETFLRLAQALDVEPAFLVWGPAGQPVMTKKPGP